MDLELAGKVALVTGASKGIGLAITRSLAAEGVRVVAGARAGSSELDVLAETAGVQPVLVDLSTPDGPATLVEQTLAKHGFIDILVNNVGAVRPRLRGFVEVTDADWEQTMTINFFAAARTMRAALPPLTERGGSVITISSINAFLPDPGVIDYCAAKGALSNLCKALSKEYGGKVRINTISPGPVQTDLWLGAGGVAATIAETTGSSSDAIADRAAAEAPTGRFSRPQEVADLVVFLASDRAANVTGSDFVIDGGLVTTL